ncbi:MAG: FHIPEP family type III secretion protein [Kofleriaceae bacterium]
MPPLAIRDDLRLRLGGYRVLLAGVPVADAAVQPHRVLAIDPSGTATAGLPGEATTEPTFGLPAKWLLPSERGRAEAAGCTVVDASAVIATHLTELLRRHAAELLGRRELQQLLDVVARTDAKLVEELIPHHLGVADVLRVLRGLLSEGVSIRDLRTILEALADHAPSVKHPDELVELVRQRLARRLTRAQLGADGSLRPLVLDPRAEAALREGTSRHARLLTRLTEDLATRTRELAVLDEPPLVVVAPDVRRAVAGIAARHAPGLAVMSFREVDPTVPFITRGVIAAMEPAT